jgi:hypothetical protein
MTAEGPATESGGGSFILKYKDLKSGVFPMTEVIVRSRLNFAAKGTAAVRLERE